MNYIKSFKLPYEENKVPENMAGIYFINTRFPSRYELGFSKKTDLEIIKDNISYKMTLFYEIYSFNNLNGLLKENKRDLIATKFKIQAESFKDDINLLSNSMLSNINTHNEIDELINLLQNFFQQSPALYVGITEKQSFKDRLKQHRSPGSAIYKFLKENNYDWSNFMFNCIQVNNISVLNDLESLIQAIYRPKFCLA